MKLEITAESVASAVYISWGVASEADTHSKWLDRWGVVETQLKGIWSVVIVNWSYSSTENERAEAEILMEEINFLRNIASHRRFNWRAK